MKDGKIIRITPIEFDENDAQPWTIKARGKSFTPPRKTTVNATRWPGSRWCTRRTGCCIR